MACSLSGDSLTDEEFGGGLAACFYLGIGVGGGNKILYLAVGEDVYKI